MKSVLSLSDIGDRSIHYRRRVFDGTRKVFWEEEPDLHVYALENFESENSKDLTFFRGDKIRGLVQCKSG
jgi:hypothetical protein